mgnify:CR=1 FL=1
MEEPKRRVPQAMFLPVGKATHRSGIKIRAITVRITHAPPVKMDMDMETPRTAVREQKKQMLLTTATPQC